MKAHTGQGNVPPGSPSTMLRLTLPILAPSEFGTYARVPRSSNGETLTMGDGAEEWARRIISCHLDLPVENHDDGSEPGMYDLRVGPAEAPLLAVEVTGAVDELWTQTWNTGPARGRIALPEGAGRWIVSVEPGSNIKRLQRELPALLLDLAHGGVSDIYEVDLLAYRDARLHERLSGLGIESAHQTSSQPGVDYVHLTLPGQGGAVDSTGTETPRWVGSFLRDPRRRDCLEKLARAPTDRREMFIGVTLAGAPWAVTSYLTNIAPRDLSLPPSAPDLPPPVTGLWLAPTMTFRDGLGVRWDGSHWSPFRTRGEGIDDAD